jgi:hypothetical protein
VLGDSDGLYNVAVRITDNAGNQTLTTKQIRLDTSGPALTETGLTNGQIVGLGQTITLKISDTDADGVSSIGAQLDGTALAAALNGTTTDTINTDGLTAGQHTLTITATDALGNKTTLTVTFTLVVTAAGLASAVQDGQNRGLIDQSLSIQLQNKMGAINAAISRGDKVSAKLLLQSFIAYIQSNASQKKIDAGYSSSLIGWASSLVASLG